MKPDTRQRIGTTSGDLDLRYFFDPLCGWCYGAAPAIDRLRDQCGIRIRLMPSGLFAAAGARPLDAAMAEHILASDARIHRLTGQSFTQTYRRNLLGNSRPPLDSWPATLALSVYERAHPDRGLDFLGRLQRARYVEGLDLTDRDVLADLAATAGYERRRFAAAFEHPDEIAEAGTRVARVQNEMARNGISGVPALVLRSGEGETRLDSSLYMDGSGAALCELIGTRCFVASAS